MILSALASSGSLSTITHFRCGRNQSWFTEGKESNVNLLCDAIRAMTSLEYLDLNSSNYERSSKIYTEAMLDQIVNAIVANKEKNSSLVAVNLFKTAVDYDPDLAAMKSI